MKLTKEQIVEILYKSCEENDTDIGSIKFDEILDGLNKHLNEYLGQSLPIDSVSVPKGTLLFHLKALTKKIEDSHCYGFEDILEDYIKSNAL